MKKRLASIGQGGELAQLSGSPALVDAVAAHRAE